MPPNVTSYDILLDINFKKLTYEGRVRILVKCQDDLTLNSQGLKILTVSKSGEDLEFELDAEDLVIKAGPVDGVLDVTFQGKVTEDLVGFYKAPYENTYMLTTQFEAASARRMFPCIDHPDYKATFALNVVIDKELDVISNMPIRTVEEHPSGKKVSFHETPRMSTYLLYLGIGNFEEIRDKFENIDLIVATPPNQSDKGKFALQATKDSMQFYHKYFGIPYELPKIHLLAIPEFAAGAMENWGAITFREIVLLVDEKSTVSIKKAVVEVVAHELAHQWFGNLVTMRWWNDLWLNESFATFVAYKVVHSIHPEWKAWEDFLNDETAGAMSRDSLRNTHPIEVVVNSPSEIEQIFDSISYGKGASILRMIEAYMGPEEFRVGVANYLRKFELANATGDDLWTSLEDTAKRPIKRVVNEWLKKPGFPMITVSYDKGKLLLRQERFLISGESGDGIWPIPLTMKVDGEDMVLLMDEETKELDVKEPTSLKVNVDRTGFYRVHYTDLYQKVWRSDLSSFDTWGLISDALAFVVSRRMQFQDYLEILKWHNEETEYLPVFEISDQLSFLDSIIPSRVSEISKDFHSVQIKRLEGSKDENSVMLRGIMMGRLAMVDEGYARSLGSKMEEYDSVEVDARSAVAVAYARSSGNFDELEKRYTESRGDEERSRFLRALMSFKDSRLVSKSFEMAFTKKVKRQDVTTMIMSAARNREAREIAWNWIKSNYDKLRKLHQGTGGMSRLALAIIPILGIGRIEEMEKFFLENSFPEAEKGVEAGMERLRIYDRFVKSIE
ncbi:MAG: M1 family metallopeptidase [Nitrososphaerales archaeon]